MLHRHASVDSEDLTGDVSGGRTGEEEDSVGDVIDLTEVSERDFGHDACFEVIGEFVGHVGGDETGGDGITGDLASGQFACDGFGEADEASLGGGVVGLSGISNESDDGADIDDARVSAFHKRTLKGFDEVEGSFEIGVENGVPIFAFHAHEEAVARDAGVVDEDVNATEVFEDLLSCFLNCVVVSDVESVEAGAVGELGIDCLGRRAAAGFVSANDGDFGSFTSEGMGDGFADAATGSSDDNTFS